MAKNVRLKLNSAGIRGLLLSDDVASDIHRRAVKVAAKAGPGFAAERDTLRRIRSASRVVTRSEHAKNVQARDNTLVRCLDAAND